ncbi:hypothetical protein BKP37_06815 [Anaerobacillus alkalilacustris]|uniref:Methyl-accepting chemotaxis protein n=1 Tax=Anaerobacillus alkalilacustris TaxID=393763 RepID=A0A1S2LUT5_9BACI|nr:methyl-accepting chemotaxis protein [Anaerobacillus alkalilacustris]OIJ15125.1 hypothetical protein BKP37_06815 [Anaerobacillus alkalilacustris]
MKSIRGKIISGFSMILLLLLMMSAYNLFNVYKINTTVEQTLQEYLQILRISEDLAYNTEQRLDAANRYILLNNSTHKERYMNLREESKVLEEEILKLNDNYQLKELMKESHTWDRMITEEIFVVYEKNDRETALESFQRYIDPLADEIVVGYRNLSGLGQTKIIEIRNDMEEHGRTAVTYNIVVIVIGIILTFVVALVVAKKIISPIKVVVERVEQVAKGDLSNKEIEVRTKDEIGRLTASINQMATSLRNLLSKTVETSDHVVAASEEITSSSEQTTVANNQIVATIQEVSQGAELTVNSAKECARAMEEMTVGIQRIAESSSIVSESSLEATQEAENGKHSLRKVIEQMYSISQGVKDATLIIGRLGERSKEIGSILGVITDISDQTNLLALNAAIEAARAGEHGKGFAVVADEVRKLAEESRKSAEKVSSVIREIQADTAVAVYTMDSGTIEVHKGINVVGETSSIFEKIVTSIQNVSIQIQEVTAVAEEMSASTEEVNASVEDMAEVTVETSDRFKSVMKGSEQQLAAMVEIETSANSLRRLAQELQVEVKKFKV